MLERGWNTLVHTYTTHAQGVAAVDALIAAGLDRQHISVIANDPVAAGLIVEEASDHLNSNTGRQTGEAFGSAFGGGLGLLIGGGAIAVPGLIGVLALGWITTMVGGAILGGTAGGLIGTLIGSGSQDTEAQKHEEAVRKGGTLVLVKCTDEQRDQMRAILNQAYAEEPVIIRPVTATRTTNVV